MIERLLPALALMSQMACSQPEPDHRFDDWIALTELGITFAQNRTELGELGCTFDPDPVPAAQMYDRNLSTALILDGQGPLDICMEQGIAMHRVRIQNILETGTFAGANDFEHYQGLRTTYYSWHIHGGLDNDDWVIKVAR